MLRDVRTVIASPLWPDEMTAIGTVALAFVTLAAILVTLMITRRDRQNAISDSADERKAADDRVDRQISASAEQLQAERKAADDRLERQTSASAAQLELERTAADERLRRQIEAAADEAQLERELAKDREQLAEAYAVQVTAARMDPQKFGSQITTSDQNDPITCPCVFVVNSGHYTITRIEAQFSPEGASLLTYGRRTHLSSWARLPPEVIEQTGLARPERNVRNDTLTPADMGLLFAHDAMAESKIFGCYPIVRWRDHWGQMWEHKLGVVRKITEGDQWRA